jgi:hypothetical protein
MSNTKDQPTIKFTNKADFNEICSPVHPDAYGEFEKLSNLLSSIVSKEGPDSFSTTLVVYNTMKKLVGILGCRSVEDKEDLYKALAQMLYFPMSLNSELFIVAQDSRVKLLSKETYEVEKVSDALIVTYVTPSNCIIFTVPYEVLNNNTVNFMFDDAWISCIHGDNDKSKNGPVGDMLELFYTFSHTATTGPFSPHEVLAFLKANGFNFEIINPNNMTNSHIALPIAM